MQGKKRKSRQFFTPFGLALFVLSVVYIVAEAIFNMQLLEVAGTVKSSPHDIENLQYFGRSISAYGFTLLTLGIFESTGFRLLTRAHWVRFFIVAAACMTPFVVIFTRSMQYHPAGASVPVTLQPVEIMVSTLPLLGILIATMSAGRFRPQLFVALILLAWPAMFLGQKLLIESYVIDKTNWKERQNARYMLMLRAGLEDCILHLGDLQMCNDEKGAPDMKATRIIMSALWMMNPDTVLNDLQQNRNAIIESAATRGVWFSPTEQYQKYIDKVAATRSKYEQQFMRTFHDKYYAPYKKASDMYKRAMDEKTMGAEANEGAQEVEQGMDEGWKKYQQAVFDFSQTISIVVGEAVRQSMALGGTVNAYCSVRGDCPDVGVKPQEVKDAQNRAVREFITRTGYPPTIQVKDEFLAYPKTQGIIRDKVQQTIRDRMGLPNFTLPPDWVYDRKSFRGTLIDLVRGQVQDKWISRFGKQLPPGLDEQAFAGLLGIDTSMPPMEKLVMSEDEFFHKYIVPGNQKMIQSMLDDLSNDRKKYDDNAADMQAGKDYVEALYIPTISLVISLSVVLLTLFRGLMLLPDAMGRAGWIKNKVSHGSMQVILATISIALLLAMPRMIPNPYASGDTYKRYLSDASQVHPAIAKLLNWAVHVQPVIYRVGNNIAHRLKRKTPETVSEAPPQPQIK